MTLKCFAIGISLLAASAFADENPETGAHQGSQAAADIVRSFAGSDGAFLVAGLVKPQFDKDNLATILQYPSDEIVVLNLTGAQVKQAFERSLSMFPQPNSSFLQISGFEVSFSKNPSASPRVLSVTANGSKIEDNRTYSVAMPGPLGRGGQGYFKIWDKAKIAKTFSGTTLEDVLRGKKFTESSPRWVSQD